MILRMSAQFDPNAAASDEDGFFGLPHSADEARVHLISIPFDATTSYRSGASRGPEAVREASLQVDLYDLDYGKPYEVGIYGAEPDSRFDEWNRAAHESVAALREDEANTTALDAVNELCARTDNLACENARAVLSAGKLPVGIGGDHATAFGLIEACAEKYPNLGVLQFDAHADLRIAYEGFQRSHASIMNNVLCNFDVKKLVQVGVRDLCEEEANAIRDSGGLIHTLFDRDWARAKLAGEDLRALAEQTIAELPDEVYLSFDIDGLDPALCPNTGTPVPGGLDWHEAMLWLEVLARSKKRVVGMDLCEVNPGPGDASGIDSIVGARLVYRMIAAATCEI